MSYRVRVTKAAEADIENISRWLAERSQVATDTWLERCRDALNSLANRAEICGLAPESKGHQEPIRQLIFKTKRGHRYRALFAIREGNVVVLHVRGPGQPLLKRDELE